MAEGGTLLDPIIVELLSLLDGKGLPRHVIKSVDAVESRSFPFQPIVLRRKRRGPNTVSYIAGIIVTDDANRNVILVQESKKKFRGCWYLPSGKVETEERLVDSVKREALEESGLEVEPQTLVAVEMNHRCWFRFFFAGKVVGGDLKKPHQADEHSIQAEWAQIRNVANQSDGHHKLRFNDILWVFDTTPPVVQDVLIKKTCPPLMPINKSRNQLYFASILAFRDENGLLVLGSVRSGRHLPITVISEADATFSCPIDRLVKDVWMDSSPVITYDIIGLLALEHDPQRGDGLLMALLCLVTTRRLPKVENSNYIWVPLTSSHAKKLKDKLNFKGITPVVVKI